MSDPPDWPDDIFSCLDDVGLCCQGFFCLCCVLSDNYKKVDNPDNCTKGCFASKMSEFWVRQTIRRRQNMPEDFCNDCILSRTCLLPLAACQTQRALRLGFGVPLPGEGYYGHVISPINQLQTNTPLITNSQPSVFTPPPPPDSYTSNHIQDPNYNNQTQELYPTNNNQDSYSSNHIQDPNSNNQTQNSYSSNQSQNPYPTNQAQDQYSSNLSQDPYLSNQPHELEQFD